MVRVTIVGAGIAGLTAALFATTAGHHVVVLDRTDRLGGRGTSENVKGAPFGFGPHLIQQRGPLMQTIKKISKLPVVLNSPRIDRTHAAGVGALRPRNNVRRAAGLRRAFRVKDTNSMAVQAAAFLAGSGLPTYDDRFVSLQKEKLSVVGEGWAGLVGRMAAALDEVGVLIEPNCKVASIEPQRINLEDGRTFETDVVVLACGLKQASALLGDLDGHEMELVQSVRASTIDATLSSRPLGEHHALIDAAEGAYVLDLANIQPRWGLDGSYFSALAAERPGESSEERMQRLDGFLDHHAPGWHHHVVDARRQPNISVQSQGVKPEFDAFAHHGVLLAGEWVNSPHLLADAAADTGRLVGRNITKACP
jgi:glycine/D-amino acid oxidase-like deaminating enzyme